MDNSPSTIHENALALARQLLVYTPEFGIPRVHVGRTCDGGYVMLDKDLKSLECFYSYGISNDYSFDTALHEKCGAVGRLFDPSVNHPNKIAEGLTFDRIGLATGQGTIRQHISRYQDNGRRMILKIDVEGAEWEWLPETSSDEIAVFDQVLIELHGLNIQSRHLFYAGMLSKLNEDFHLFHVHANNYTPMTAHGNVILPDVLECSYIRKDLCPCKPNTTETFPIKDLDFACDSSDDAAPDWTLDFWPFISQQDIAWEKTAKTNAEEAMALHEKITRMRRKSKNLEFRLSCMEGSFSWRVTRPCRKAYSILQKWI